MPKKLTWRRDPATKRTETRLLEQAKKAEAGVDALVLIFLQTIEKL
jgi:hypothetical protein